MRTLHFDVFDLIDKVAIVRNLFHWAVRLLLWLHYSLQSNRNGILVIMNCTNGLLQFYHQLHDQDSIHHAVVKVAYCGVEAVSYYNDEYLRNWVQATPR